MKRLYFFYEQQHRYNKDKEHCKKLERAGDTIYQCFSSFAGYHIPSILLKATELFFQKRKNRSFFQAQVIVYAMTEPFRLPAECSIKKLPVNWKITEKKAQLCADFPENGQEDACDCWEEAEQSAVMG